MIHVDELDKTIKHHKASLRRLDQVDIYRYTVKTEKLSIPATGNGTECAPKTPAANPVAASPASRLHLE